MAQSVPQSGWLGSPSGERFPDSGGDSSSEGWGLAASGRNRNMVQWNQDTVEWNQNMVDENMVEWNWDMVG